MGTDTIHPSDTEKIALVDKMELKHPSQREIHQHLQNRLTAAGSPPFQPYPTNCDTTYHAVHNSGTRPLSVLKHVVIHSTEGGTAKSTASYFTTQQSGGSTQLIVDDVSCYRTLRNDQIPWGAPGVNYDGFHIEQCGYAAWAKSLWSVTHNRTLRRAAYKTAYHCKLFGIPIQFVDAAGLKSGKAGITTHAEATKAFGGTHTDPGKGWPKTLFMSYVRVYALKIKIKRAV